ncbi:hypothetical protein VIGAN_06079100 [Vigna angularis var. angularis]|uniref:Uncharacterized protein n=1 Tax=Vigna angularis var. angularis TaxID=157739 RepID=A0A0S3SA56_PHAAN|nr:hypothetical protein VIGAN_06079100 [Vigna angularis var. angularis]
MNSRRNIPAGCLSSIFTGEEQSKSVRCHGWNGVQGNGRRETSRHRVGGEKAHGAAHHRIGIMRIDFYVFH